MQKPEEEYQEQSFAVLLLSLDDHSEQCGDPRNKRSPSHMGEG
jgi:hypothetical protein